jgi:cell wall-associated NlpC family hydrolase
VGLLAAALFAASAVMLATGGADESAEAGEPSAEQLRLAALQIPDEPSTIAKEKPPKPEHLDVIPSKQEAKQAVADAKQKEAKAQEKVEVKVPPELVGTPAEGMPAVSAGKNGTHDAPSARLDGIDAETVPVLSRHEAEGRAILLGDTALAPASAPPEVQEAISAANQIVGTPYIWGGGHASWYSKGYDCSGAVSYALGGAGLLGAPMTSGALANWGEPGPGRWITVYANAGHTYAVIAGLRWDTAGNDNGDGPRWHAEVPYPEGYTVRHPPGL